MENIIATARSVGRLNTLICAARAVGLDETLTNAGPFTVFAPNDEAFDNLPPGTVDSLFNNILLLKTILNLHLLSGAVLWNNVLSMKSARTVQGQHITVDTKNGAMVNKAKVIRADVIAENGVIHVIDRVILPKELEQLD